MPDIPGVAREPTVPQGAAELQRLQAAGFSNDELIQHKQDTTKHLMEGGFLPAEVDKYWGDTQPSVPGLHELQEANIKKLAGVDKPFGPKITEGPLEALGAGWGMGNIGMLMKGRAPDTVLPQDAGMLNKVMYGLGQMSGDLPAMLAGVVVGTPAGATLGTAVAPGPGTVVGGIMGAGVGGAGLPEALRQVMIGAYRRGEIHTWSDFMQIASEGLQKTATAMTVGAVAAPLGVVGGKVVGSALARSAEPLAATVSTGLAFTGVGAVLEGKVPDAQDFAVGAILGLAVHTVGSAMTPTEASRTVQSNLEGIYRDTGMPPWQAVELSKTNPKVRDEMLGQTIDGEPITDAIRPNAPPEPEPFLKPSEDGKPPVVPPKPPLEGEVIPPKPQPKKLEEPEDITKLSEDDLNSKFNDRIGEPAKPDSLLDPKNWYRQWVSELGPAREIDKLLAEKNPTYDRKTEITIEDMFRQTYASETRAGLFVRYGQWLPGKTEFKKTSDVSVMTAVRQVKQDGGNLNDWRNYMLAKRTVDKANQGVETGFDLMEAAELVRRGEKKYEKATALFNDVMDGGLEYAKASGLLNEAQVKALQEANPTYIPMRRVMGEETAQNAGTGRNFKVSSPYKKMEGSERMLVEPMVQAIDNLHLTIKMADRNRAIGTVLEAADKGGYLKDLGFKQIEAPEIKATIAKPGSDVFEPYLEQDTRAALEPFVAQRHIKGSLNQNRFLYIRDGKPEMWEATNPMFAKLMRGADSPGEAFLADKIFSAIAKVQRTGITMAPDYMIRNPLRDQLSAFILDPLHPPPYLTMMKGLYDSFKLGDKYQDWVANGGAGSSLVEMDTNYLARDMHKVFEETGTWKRMWNTYGHPIEGARLLAERLDAASRIGYDKRGEAMGLSPMKAATGSRKAYLDFQEKGTLEFAQMWARWVPFFRTSITGIKQFGEAAKERPWQTLGYSVAALQVPAIISYVLNNIQDEHGDLPENRKYKNMERWQKDTKLVFPEVAGVRLGVAYPPELGFLVGGTTIRFLDWFRNEDPKAFNGWASGLVSALTPPLVPSFILPSAEQVTNKHLSGPLFGKPIIPASLADKVSGDLQYTENTTEVAKKLAQVMGPRTGLGVWENANPIVIENYVKNWTGTAGMTALRLMNAPFNQSGRPWEVSDIPFVSGFVTRNPHMNAQPIQDFFEENHKLEVSLADLALARKHARLGVPGAEAELNTAIEQKMQPLRGIAEALRLKRDVLVAVNNDKTMNTDEKRQFAEQAYSDMIIMSRDGLRRIREMKQP